MSTMYTVGFGLDITPEDKKILKNISLPDSPVRYIDDDEDPSKPLVLVKTYLGSVLLIARSAGVYNELPDFPALDDVTDQERAAFEKIAPGGRIKPIVVEE